MAEKPIKFCLCALIAIFVMPSVIFAASFDCGKVASEVEKLICSDDELSKLDDSLKKEYQKALKTQLEDKIVESQRQWLKKVRNGCQNAVKLDKHLID